MAQGRQIRELPSRRRMGGLRQNSPASAGMSAPFIPEGARPSAGQIQRLPGSKVPEGSEVPLVMGGNGGQHEGSPHPCHHPGTRVQASPLGLPATARAVAAAVHG